MSPYARTIWTLIVALVLWSPACYQTISGRLDATMSALLFLGALILSYLGVGIVDFIADRYRRTAEHVEYTKLQIEFLERKAAEQQKRRATDLEDSTNAESQERPG